MSLTRLDCGFTRGVESSLDTSSYVALNPSSKPGSLVVAGATAARGTIGGQVACRLSLEHFVEGVLDYFTQSVGSETQSLQVPLPGVDPQQEISVQVLEAAFKRANTSVYSFGHKLAAGGRMAASLIGLVIEGNSIAAGRVGTGAIYLYRNQELFPFFEKATSVNSATGADSFVGAQSLVSVELASVACIEGDLILLFSAELDSDSERKLGETLSSGWVSAEHLWIALKSICDRRAFSVYARVGPQAIYLSRAV